MATSSPKVVKDFDLRTVCEALGDIKTKWFAIGIQLGIPHNKLVEFKKEDDPLSAVVDYWLRGNVTESVVPISWKSIVAALKSKYVGEPKIAQQINERFCSVKMKGTTKPYRVTTRTKADDGESSPSSSLELDLKHQLNLNRRQIEKQYAFYITSIQTIVEEKKITAKNLSVFLVSSITSTADEENRLKLLADMESELKSAEDIADIFILLNSKYASYLNPDIYVSILEKYGSEEEQKKLNYPKHLKDFVQRHTIKEFVEMHPELDSPKLRKLGDNSEEVRIKFNISQTQSLSTLQEVTGAVAKVLGLRPSILRLYGVKEGCVLVTLLIPTSIANTLFTRDTVFTPEQQRGFQAASVLWLECNGQKFDFSEKDQSQDTSAIVPLENLEDQLNCPICLDTYTNPKQLQCNHVYCQQCLAKLVFRDQQGQLVLTCPNCRQVTPVPASGVASLQSAFQINKFLEIVENYKKPRAAFSPKKRAVIPTKIITSENIDTAGCPEHGGREMELYCNTCEETICFKCIMLDEKHHSHKYEELDKAFERYKGEITASLEPMKKQLDAIKKALAGFEARHREICDQQAAIEADIHTSIIQLHQILEVRETELIGQLHQLTQAKLKSLAVQRNQLETTQAQLSSCLHFMRENLKTKNPGEVLLMKSTTFRQAKELTTTFQHDMLKPSTEADMIFSALADITAECQNYGRVSTLASPDPSKCYATGYAVSATVEEKSAITVRTVNCSSQPCMPPVTAITCELVSEIAGTRAECCKIERKRQNQYEVSYQPTIKGRHQLNIKVEGQHIRGSPFPVSVWSPVEKLGTPILTISDVKKPMGVAVNQRGEIMVTEANDGCVSMYCSSGEKLQSFGTFYSSEFLNPADVAVDTEGNILVADQVDHRIVKFTAQGVPITEMGTEGIEDGNLYPRGIAVNASNGRVYVVSGSRIQILNSDLSTYKTFGKRGKGLGQFDKLRHIACDSTGNVYVADYGNNCIQVFTSKGEFVRSIGRRGEGRGELREPHGITIDSSDRLYVSEWGNDRVSMFTLEGEFLKSFGSRGRGLGQFRSPRGLAVDSSGVVYVCDSSNYRVQLF